LFNALIIIMFNNYTSMEFTVVLALIA